MRTAPRLDAKRMAFGSLCTALIVLFLSASSFAPSLDLTLSALAAFVLHMLFIEFGTVTALIAFFSSAALSLLLLPNKECALFYVFIFGWYPFVRAALSKLPLWLSWTLKILLACACGFLFCLFFMILFPVPSLMELLQPWAMFLYLAAFVLYELGLARWILFYRCRLRHKLFGK